MDVYHILAGRIIVNEVLVSVIVAAYNSEKYIENCIVSILGQTHHIFELIIVNDGSTDRTGEICDEIAEKDSRVLVLHQKNSGVGIARNNGLSHAKGEFITFIDSDDEVSKYYLENLLFPCVEKKCDISACYYQYVNYGDKYTPNISQTYSVMPIDYRVVQPKIIGRCCGTMINRRVLSGISFDSDLFVGEDLLFLCRAINNSHSIAVTEDQLYCYYIYEESSYNGKYNDKKFTEIISWNRVIELFKDRPDVFANTVKRVYGWILLNNLLRMQEGNYSNEVQKQYCLNQLRKMIVPVFNRYPGGGERSIAMYPIYIISCISPRTGHFIFKNMMSLKHMVQKIIRKKR